MSDGLDVLVDGLAFPEAPRWHEGQLWFSDMHGGQVLRTDLRGNMVTVTEVPGNPAGLGWLPDGRLLVVSMHDRRVLRLDVDGLTEHADLSSIATWHCNDMVVDEWGRAYVGNFGSDAPPEEPITASRVALVAPMGEVREAAAGMYFPNGMAITPDGQSMVVAETRSDPPRLTAFDIGAGGVLTERRVLASFEREAPDGICLDAAGCVWAASPFTREVLRVDPVGRVTRRIPTGGLGAYACALGGELRTTLFICAAGTWVPEEAVEQRTGCILTCEVDVPGAGLP